MGYVIGDQKKTYPKFEELGENPYDDMLVVLKGNRIYAFAEVNFEGSTAKGEVYYRQRQPDGSIVRVPRQLDGENPTIKSGTYTLNATLHNSSYYALSLENNGRVPTNGQNPRWPDRQPPYADFIHIHRGGTDWNWSEGCITMTDPGWTRFINLFPRVKLGTQIGTFYLLD